MSTFGKQQHLFPVALHGDLDPSPSQPGPGAGSTKRAVSRTSIGGAWPPGI